ncbi:TIGR02677 family protein [Tengunoibacter tsumagoiensis]|uniref:TIGR02677 family protein n=1 Tax=Tengunoibacter tsumagoiensis TaxID=2014871 RepID=A0A401ZVK2_9CHLR|nr:TIGR02677 family protein [Tengunoibacter tsumagoiensis]GCE10822.1 hypothetical protein KTT_06810 [Tengunoibacter tsumagoiensis]
MSLAAEQNSQPTEVSPETSSNRLVSSFKPSGAITLFNYLTPISDRVDWYRSIMRIFLQRSREYRYQLTAQDVLDVLRTEATHEYTLEACRNDLARLVTWGNLSTLYDTSRVTTIADFRSPVLLYQATQEALAIEAFLAEQARIGASEGGLYQGDLPRLWEVLERLDTWLQSERGSYTTERYQEIAEQWRIAFTTWEKLTNDAAQYLGSMNRSSQQAFDIDSFLIYKNIVVLYVQSFAQQLVEYSQSIRTLLADWTQSGKQALLVEVVSEAPPPSQTLVEHQELWHEDVERQVSALLHWFAREMNVNMFLKAAHDAVDKVVHRAHMLATSMRPQTDYVSMLYSLGNRLLTTEDFTAAQMLFAAGFANTLPIHLPEGMTGTPEIAERAGSRPTWQAPATVTRNLRPLYKGYVERTVEQPMRSNQSELAALRQEYEKQQQAQKVRFDRLFSRPILDLATLGRISPDERQMLVQIIDGCLCSATCEYSLSDGTVVTLLNRDEQHMVSLQARDGILTLPRYRLQLVAKVS